MERGCSLIFCNIRDENIVSTSYESMSCITGYRVASVMKIMYDGDALNFTMLIEKNLTRLFKTFSPYFNIPHPGSPFSISKYLTFLGPGHATMANYLKGKDDGKDIILQQLKEV